MMRSLYSAVSGLKTHQTRMDVIGNNIANVNTEAFKSSSVTFSEIMYQTLSSATSGNGTSGTGGVNAKQIGLGVSTGSTTISIETAGAAETTGNPFDLKLTDSQTTNFFIVSDGTQTMFTRAGSFYVDGNGYLCMSSTGYTLMGWQVGEDGNINKAKVSSLQVMSPTNLSSQPEATEKGYVSGVLDKNDTNLYSDDGYVLSLGFYDSKGYSYSANFKVKPAEDGNEGEYTIALTDILDSDGVSILKDASDPTGETYSPDPGELFSTGTVNQVNKTVTYTAVDSKGTTYPDVYNLAADGEDPVLVTTDKYGNLYSVDATTLVADTSAVEYYKLKSSGSTDVLYATAEDVLTTDTITVNNRVKYDNPLKEGSSLVYVANGDELFKAGDSFYTQGTDGTLYTTKLNSKSGVYETQTDDDGNDLVAAKKYTSSTLGGDVYASESASTTNLGLKEVTSDTNTKIFTGNTSTKFYTDGTYYYVQSNSTGDIFYAKETTTTGNYLTSATVGSVTTLPTGATTDGSKFYSGSDEYEVYSYYDSSTNETSYYLSKDSGATYYSTSNVAVGTRTEYSYDGTNIAYYALTDSNSKVTYASADSIVATASDKTITTYDPKEKTTDTTTIYGLENESTKSTTDPSKNVWANGDKVFSIDADADGEVDTNELYAVGSDGNVYAVTMNSNGKYVESANPTYRKYTATIGDTESNVYLKVSSDGTTDTSLTAEDIGLDSKTYTTTKTVNEYEPYTLVYDPNTGNFVSCGVDNQAEGTSLTLKLGTIIKSFQTDSDGNSTVYTSEDEVTTSKFSDIEIDFSTSLNYNNNGVSTLKALKGDTTGDATGKKTGALTGLTVNADGKIYGTYDNGNTDLLGQIAVAQFSNASGLEKIGDNCYQTTLNSGDFDGIGVAVDADGSSISTGELEMSNVDLSSEFTSMIITQRGFQANSRVITTSDTLLEELINLKR